jgi:hypothetical protein
MDGCPHGDRLLVEPSHVCHDSLSSPTSYPSSCNLRTRAAKKNKIAAKKMARVWSCVCKGMAESGLARGEGNSGARSGDPPGGACLAGLRLVPPRRTSCCQTNFAAARSLLALGVEKGGGSLPYPLPNHDDVDPGLASPSQPGIRAGAPSFPALPAAKPGSRNRWQRVAEVLSRRRSTIREP